MAGTPPVDPDRRPTPPLQPHVARLVPSLIRDIANSGIGTDDVIPLWFGESDAPTPDFIKQAAVRALAENRTFYTANRGIPPLREAISRYLGDLYGRPVGTDRVTVTASGMNGIMVLMQLIVAPGCNVVMTSPMWPNGRECVHLLGGESRPVTLDGDADGWRLDLDRLFDAVDGATRAVFVNSPSNPTGWVMPRDQQEALLSLCRERGIWLLADEVYDRFAYAAAEHAPSFLELAAPDDPVVVINSFSKSWSMTGWRLGWLVTPPALGTPLETLIEFNIAAPTSFAQYAAVAALEEGEAFIRGLASDYRAARDRVGARLASHERVRVIEPDGGFYHFFAVKGMASSVEAARRLVREARVGLAPGAAFGPGGEGHMRLCFANRHATLDRALDRLLPALDGI